MKDSDGADIIRPYTLITFSNDKICHFDLIIKEYPNGIMLKLD